VSLQTRPKPIVLIGAGGIGAPAAWVLAEAGVRELVVVDDDQVELSNLHRQILFADEDVGASKCEAFEAAFAERYPELQLRLITTRAVPDTVVDIVEQAGVLIDATDNFASRFLLADAAYLGGVPIVHAAAVRWQATVLSTLPQGRPCYRCLFEDIPGDISVDCATAGVAAPVCGVSGAFAADRALRLMRGDDTAAGHIVTYDGLLDRLRSVQVRPRPGCLLCGPNANIGDINPSRYMGGQCEAY